MDVLKMGEPHALIHAGCDVTYLHDNQAEQGHVVQCSLVTIPRTQNGRQCQMRQILSERKTPPKKRDPTSQTNVFIRNITTSKPDCTYL
jgi:hypothetical protein